MIKRGNLRPEETKDLEEILNEAGLVPSQGQVTEQMLNQKLSLSHEEQTRLTALEERQRLSPREEKTLDQLYEDIYYLREFERIERDRKEQRIRERSVMLDLQEELVKSKK